MSAPKLFCIGNPLLDMQVNDGEALLEKYKLKANDAILAEASHSTIYEEIVEKYKITYVAGGAAQNAARGAAYILPPGSVVYTGCVGDDDLADQLRAANKREGLQDAYMIKKGDKTGACAVVITGHHRSLVTDLRSAEKFDKAHLATSELQATIESAKVFYVEGYFLTHGSEGLVELAKKTSESGKTFVINLSAPFIPQFFKVQLEQLLPYADYVIGNEAEAAAWAESTGQPGSSEDLVTIAKALASIPKANAARPRTVIFTHGAESTIAVSASALDQPKIYSVSTLSDNQIVDTNGAGDAFAGGFIAGIVLGKGLDDSVEIGHRMGAMCVQQVGPQYKWPKVDVLS